MQESNYNNAATTPFSSKLCLMIKQKGVMHVMSRKFWKLAALMSTQLAPFNTI